MYDSVHDRTRTTVCSVILYPADGGDPTLTRMVFSAEGAKAHPLHDRDRYRTNVDLRSLYGEENMFAIRSKEWGVESLDLDEQYALYHNISPELPINLAMARLVGADPKMPGRRPLWRGDVVVIKRSKWPPRGWGYKIYDAQMDRYLDMPPGALDLFNFHLIPKWYNSDKWLDFLQDEVHSCAFASAPSPSIIFHKYFPRPI